MRALYRNFPWRARRRFRPSVGEADLAHLDIDDLVGLAGLRQAEQRLELLDRRLGACADDAIQLHVVIAEGLQPGLDLDDAGVRPLQSGIRLCLVGLQGHGNGGWRHVRTGLRFRHGSRLRRCTQLIQEQRVDLARCVQSDLLLIGLYGLARVRAGDAVDGAGVEIKVLQYALHLLDHRVALYRGGRGIGPHDVDCRLGLVRASVRKALEIACGEKRPGVRERLIP
ncbi:hypothetical protein X739_26850 [Mesorhizobium sp. LNHC220B00]|nr:hypothetical protein X739_26850 [Mesorhizobium sp. LNHC220B00]ESY94498.1 hypothetical protein X741_11645 [Mesorhizobium sp. LNHC229A00]